MSISICIATYNRLDSLKKCISPILNEFEDYPYELIVADGGSTDGTIEYLKSLDNVELIEQGKLTGSVKAFNAGFKKAKGKYIAPLSDDEIINPSVWKKACRLMDEYDQIGLVTPKVQDPLYGNLHGVTFLLKEFWTLLPKSFIFRGKVLRDINYFDENFRTYYIDSDTPLSVLKKGYTIIFSKEVGLTHHRIRDENVNVSRAITQKKLKDNREEDYFKNKWKDLQCNIQKYLQKSELDKRRSLFFKKICATMFYAEWAKPWIEKNNKHAMKIFDWCLDKAVIFKDNDFDYVKDFFLAQKYPDDIISQLNK